MRRCFVTPTFIVTFVLFFSSISNASPTAFYIKKEKANKTAYYIAAMIVAGRGVIAKHQSLLNDPSIGNKNFTPEYVQKCILKNFKKITGTALFDVDPDIKTVLDQVLKAAKMSVQMNQRRINRKGVKFKGYIPAVFGREVGMILKYKSNISLKQASLRYRNIYNQPDPFERRVLLKFESQERTKGQGYGEFRNGFYRYLHPIYIKKVCLKCHGEPAGELDPTGRKKEGYKEGDLRGAISIAFPYSE